MQLFQYGKAEMDHLKSRDKKRGRAIDRIGMIERQIVPDLFKALVRSVVAQQISSKAHRYRFRMVSRRDYRLGRTTMAGDDCRDFGRIALCNFSAGDRGAEDCSKGQSLSGSGRKVFSTSKNSESMVQGALGKPLFSSS
jgi:hypothetical protein